MSPFSVRLFVGRVVLLFGGLFVMAFGTALSIQTSLGTSPITSIPLVLHLWRTRWSVGTITVGMNVVFLLLTAVLRKRASARQFVQLAFLAYYGACIDWNVGVLGGVPRLSYPVRLFLTLPGAALAGFGVWAQIRPRLPMLPGDGLVKAISEVFRFDFSRTKIVFDCLLVALAVLFSWVTMGTVNGVREGTLVAAVAVGLFIKLYERLLG